MNIFAKITDAIKLPVDLKKTFSKEGLQAFLEFAKDTIIKYVEKQDLLGPEKKARVDEMCTKYAQEHFKSDNELLQDLIDKVLIPFIPIVTQFIYDCLKKFVKDLTKENV